MYSRHNPLAGSPSSLELLVLEIARRFIQLDADGLDAAVDHAIGEIGRLVLADRSYIFLYSPDGVSMSNTHEWCGEGIEPQRDLLQDLPRSLFPWSQERFKRHPVIFVPSVDDLPDEAGAEREILREQDIQSLVLVHLGTPRGADLGFIGFDAVREKRSWNNVDARLLELVGGFIALAIERERTIDELRVSERNLKNLAAELVETESRERRRFAVQLHDGMGQSLALLRMRMLKASRDLGQAAHPQLAPCIGQVDELIANSRDLTFDLSPAVLYELGLSAALRALARRLEEQGAPRITYQETGESRSLALSARLALYASARELLANAVKHARPTSIELELIWREDAVSIEVRDDGPGIPEAAVAPKEYGDGYGLFSVRERLRTLGGRLDVPPSSGGRVVLTLPVDKDREDGVEEAQA
jgi:signal transduction histidine kinase